MADKEKEEVVGQKRKRASSDESTTSTDKGAIPEGSGPPATTSTATTPLDQLKVAFGDANWKEFDDALTNANTTLEAQRGSDKPFLLQLLQEFGFKPSQSGSLADALLKYFAETNKDPATPPFDPSTFKFVEYLDNAINNKNQKAFEERDSVIDSIKTLADKAVATTNNKTWAITLFSPRGTGKTSVVRHLALKTFNDLAQCGRLLVVDWYNLSSTFTTADGGVIIRALILYHLVRIFANTSVTISSNNSTTFPSSLTFANACLCVDSMMPVQLKIFKGLDALATKMNSVDAAVQVWKEITKAAFQPNNDLQPAFLFDTSEVLAQQKLTGLHSNGVQRTMFSSVAAAVPQDTIAVWVGTRNLHTENLPLDATGFFTMPVAGLSGLSFEATKTVRTAWKSVLTDNDLKLVWARTCGVPRLLEYAFDTKITTDSAKEALVRVKEKAAAHYQTAFQCLGNLTDKEIAMIVLSCCTGWNIAIGEKDTEGLVQVPGTDIPWTDLFYQALIFPMKEDKATILRDWFEDRIPQLEPHCLPGVKLDDLYPDVNTLLSGKQGATATGKHWEKLIAASFAARFHVHCLAKKLRLGTFIPFNDLYPSTDTHVQAVLGQFEICLENGVVSPEEEVFADEKPDVNAVVLNAQTDGAHHDVLLPVKKRNQDGSEEYLYMALQMRYGHPKGAHGLDNQLYCRPKNANEVAALLQCCSDLEGEQLFYRTSEWKNFQKDKKYAVIDGKAVSMMGLLLQILL